MNACTLVLSALCQALSQVKVMFAGPSHVTVASSMSSILMLESLCEGGDLEEKVSLTSTNYVTPPRDKESDPSG